MPLFPYFYFSAGLGADTVSRMKFWFYINIHNITPCALDYKNPGAK